MIKDIKIPEIGENVESGKVVAVLVKPGDTVEVDDGIIEVETEKAVVEIPSPERGKISEVLVEEGDDVRVGDVIAKIETEGEAEKEEEAEAQPEKVTEKEEGKPEEPEKGEEEPSEEPEEPPEREAVEKKPAEKPAAEEAERAPEEKGGAEEKRTEEGAVPASPSIRRFARELGVDVRRIQGTGPGSRISESDVKAFVKKTMRAKDRGEKQPEMGGPGPRELPDLSRWGEIETVELPTVRRLIAESTAVSWQTVPHVTQFDEADITNLEDFIGAHAEKIKKAGGKLTVTAVVVKVCAEALKRFPRFNAAIDTANNRIVYRKYIHIGMAVDTERGLLVPVIRNADRKSITDLAKEVVDLSDRTRNKKIKPDELEGGGFTVSNQGGIGGTNFTPIVLWPQVAIIGISRASVLPRFIDGGFEPRTVLPLALSYDHRMVDGADAARFLRWIRESLEQPMAIFL